MPKLTLFDELEIMDRINIVRMNYTHATGRLPTRLVLTPDELIELQMYLSANDEPAYVGPPNTNESEVFGMTFKLDTYAKHMRVYFQES